MVQKAAPLLIGGRGAETDEMIVERVPPDEQEVPALPLDTVLERQRAPAGRRRDERLGRGKSRLECRPLWLAC